jgi:hypothetical protein
LRQTVIAFNLITMTAMKTLPIRISPGQDLRAALEAKCSPKTAAQPLCCPASAACLG